MSDPARIAAINEDAYFRACDAVDMTRGDGDEMQNNGGDDPVIYSFGGRSALKVITSALTMADQTAPGRVLDFPSGHGRALRYFRAAWPAATIYAGDINLPGVEFCRQQFKAEPFEAHVDLTKTELPKNLDLIWCGSLLTHLDEHRAKYLINMMIDSLTPNGICLFTSHSRFYPRYVQAQTPVMERGLWDNIVRDYYRSGYGYKVYPGYEEQQYGMSLTSPGWIFEQLHERDDITVLFHAEKGWHGQHDVTAVQRKHLYTWYDPTKI